MNMKLKSRRNFLKRTGLITIGSMVFPIISKGISGTKITLLGDSIRMNYQPYVSLYMMDSNEIWGPDENCMYSTHLLANADKWIKNQKADIIHLNAGLHDIKTIPYNSQKNLVPISSYIDNIERIIKYIHNYWPECRIIWANITPIDNEKSAASQAERQDFNRYNEDVIHYNEAAEKLLNRLGIPVNDLFSFVMEGDKNKIMKEDGVHFTDFGNQLLGEKVADAIALFL